MTNPRLFIIAGRILDALDAEDRSVAWLAKKAGMPASTVRTQLKVHPARLSALVVATAADELPTLDLTELMKGVA